MKFQVFFSAKAREDLDELPARMADQVLPDCRRLGDNPFPDGKRIKKLRGFKEDLYRPRAGDYRVIFQRAGNRIDIVRILGKQDFERAY